MGAPGGPSENHPSKRSCGDPVAVIMNVAGACTHTFVSTGSLMIVGASAVTVIVIALLIVEAPQLLNAYAKYVVVCGGWTVTGLAKKPTFCDPPLVLSYH
jgi:hypothetical protein